jgi:hypothetical protein
MDIVAAAYLTQTPSVTPQAPSWELVIGLIGGFFTAYGVTWLRDRRVDARLSQAAREALATELIGNLETLDAYVRILTETVEEHVDAWPADKLYTWAIEHSINPTISAVLSADEQTRLLATAQMIRRLQEAMERHFHEGQLTGLFAIEGEALLRSNWLSVVGNNLVTLLVLVATKQGDFVSSKATEVAANLRPTLTGKPRSLYRLWRTSDIPSAYRPERMRDGYLVVWANDAPELVPAGVPVIELRPTQLERSMVIERSNRLARVRRFLQHRRITRAINRHKRPASTLGTVSSNDYTDRSGHPN